MNEEPAIVADERSIHYPQLFKEHVPPPIDGDFDEVARVATEILGVPFVYITLIDFQSKKGRNGVQNGDSTTAFEKAITVSMAPKAYLSKGTPYRDPEKLKVALAKFKDLHFCATLPLFSSTRKRLGTLYTFDHSSKSWCDVHWEILTTVGKIITFRTESMWNAYESLNAKRNTTGNKRKLIELSRGGKSVNYRPSVLASSR